MNLLISINVSFHKKGQKNKTVACLIRKDFCYQI